MVVVVTSFVAGGMGFYLLTKPELIEKAEIENNIQPLYWVAPMDSNFRRDAPGKSPMGMDLIPVYPTEKNEKPGTIMISPAVVNNLGVKVGNVTAGDLNLSINTVGFIQFNEESISHIHSRAEGWIKNLRVTAVGDSVKKNQPLFTLYSPELVNAQEEFVAEFKTKNQTLVKGAVRKLKALGLDDSFIEQLKRTRTVQQQVPFTAPRNGYISTLNVREGAFIQPSTEVLSIGGLQQVWVMAEIFERQAAWIKAGQRVRMTTDTYPNDEWHGVVDYVHPVLDSKTRTLSARIVFDNKDHRLKPNMFARLFIEIESKKDVLSVPREAVIYLADMRRVVKALGQGRYLSVRVNTGSEANGRIEITEGLHAGDQVVISSQFLIDSESSLTAELARFEDSKEEQ